VALKLTDRGAYCVDETCVDAADGSEDAACVANICACENGAARRGRSRHSRAVQYPPDGELFVEVQ
jgi:hypothetical protein